MVGIDLSLRSTGTAGDGWAARLAPPAGLAGCERLSWLLDRLDEHTTGAALVVVEGPSYGSAGRGQHERAGLWWLLRHRLWQASVPVAVVPPAARCRYATGRGNAPKDAVLAAAVRRFPTVEVTGNDQADALWLAAMGLDRLGRPPVALPEAHRAALASVAWPAALSERP